MKKELFRGNYNNWLLITLRYLNTDNYNPAYDTSLFRYWIYSAVPIIKEEMKSAVDNMKIEHIRTEDISAANATVYKLHTSIALIECPFNSINEIGQMLATTTQRVKNIPCILKVNDGSELMICSPIITTIGVLSSTISSFSRRISQTEGGELLRGECEQLLSDLTIPQQLVQSPTIGIGSLERETDFVPPYGRSWGYRRKNIDVSIRLYDDAASAINDNEYYWLHGIIFNHRIDQISLHEHTKTKLFARNLNERTLIISDSQTAINSVLKKISESVFLCESYDVITLNQYHTLSALIDYSPAYVNRSAHLLSLLLVNRDRIVNVTHISNLEAPNMTLKFDYDIGRKVNKKLQLVVDFKSGNRNNATYGLMAQIWALPYKPEKDYHIHSISILNELLKPDNTTEDYKELVKDYVYSTLTTVDLNEGDILTQWFRQCTAAAQKDTIQLKDAYTKLRDNLLKEYQDVQMYMDLKDLSKKKPIPGIKIDPMLRRGASKIISFDFETRMLQHIGGQDLKGPISKKYLVLKYLLVPNGKNILSGTIPLDKLYDKRTNTINITHETIVEDTLNRMKGVVH